MSAPWRWRVQARTGRSGWATQVDRLDRDTAGETADAYALIHPEWELRLEDESTGEIVYGKSRMNRTERVELVARALMGLSPEHEWTEDDCAPIVTMADTSVRGIYIELAESAVDALFPEDA